jgi:hypothetical protein
VRKRSTPACRKFRLVLLVVLDQAHELALALDRERLLVGAAFGLAAQLRLVGSSPPAQDAGLGLDLGHPLDVLELQRSQHDRPAP